MLIYRGVFPKDPLVWLKNLGFPRSNPMTNRDGIENSPILLDPEGSGFGGQMFDSPNDIPHTIQVR